MPRSPRNAISVLATSLPSRRRRPAVLVLLAFLFIAQALLVVHRIDHSKAEHTACALCVAADHSAAPPVAALHALALSPPEPVSFAVADSPRPALIVAYPPRPPPSHLLA